MSDPLEFQRKANVSRETLDRLEIYAELLKKWNRTINLVSKTTIDDLWNRHFLDSAALIPHIYDKPGTWVDLGSGAGFPGLVIAIIAAEKIPEAKVTCIETDIRKSEFLRTVSRATDVPVSVYSRRIEETPPQNAAVLTARALTSLTNLIGYAEKHLSQSGYAYFHKGKDWESELESAKEHWCFEVEKYPSLTQTEAVLLRVGEIKRV